MSNLPYKRTGHNQPPITFTGINFFWPVVVTIGCRREKRWGVLFIYPCCRAIYIKLTHTLNTSSAIMVIRNFINRRGPAV